MLTVAPPTPREFLILTVLFVLLYVFNTVQPPELIVDALTNSTAFLTGPRPLHADAHLVWGPHAVPNTKIVAHVPGWTVLDKLYVHRGIAYIVTDTPTTIPALHFIYSKGHNILSGHIGETERMPTEEDIRIISTKEAQKLFGTSAQLIDGVTVCGLFAEIDCLLIGFLSFLSMIPLSCTCSVDALANDSQFSSITHYYHWAAELWFGFWRAYSSLDPAITSDGRTTLPPLRRIWFNRVDSAHWRDYASMNQWVILASFPSVTMEFMYDWQDRAQMERPFVFERVVLADRSAAMYSYNYARFQRTAAAAFALPGSADWWLPIRNNVVGFAGIGPDVGQGTRGKPVITYISRQGWGRRMLIPEDHERLVTELYKLRDQHGYEVNIVETEKMSRVDQIKLAARTTVRPLNVLPLASCEC